MMVVRIGVDIVALQFVERIVARSTYTRLLFTGNEVEEAASLQWQRRVEYLGGRFAAKEAVGKLLGAGFASGIRWRDIEIVRDGTGRPIVRLYEAARDLAVSAGIQRIDVSISHHSGLAVACAVGLECGT